MTHYFYLNLANEWNDIIFLVNYSYLNHGNTSMVVRSEGTVAIEVDHSNNSQELGALYRQRIPKSDLKQLPFDEWYRKILVNIRWQPWLIQITQ